MFPQPTTLALGDTVVTALTDRRQPFPFPADRVFPSVPPAAWAGLRARYPASFSGPNTLMGQITCYLLQCPGQVILVDTGLGSELMDAASAEPVAQLRDGLRRAGVAPEEVSLVLLTHLDQDHVSGSVLSASGQPRPAFPNAEYCVPAADWELCESKLAAQPEANAYVRTQLHPLRAWGQLRLISAAATLAPAITAFPTPGHSPGHLSVRVGPPGEQLLILGDAFYHPLQIEMPEHSFALDYDPAAARDTRARLLEQIEAEAIVTAACHFPPPHFGRVQTLDGQRFWQPL